MDKELVDIAGRGEVLVFPTEEAARAFSVNYALTTGKGLLASSAMAFDKFAELFYPGIEGKSAAGDVDRTVFSSYAATALYDRLRYFVSPGYPEIRERLQPYFKSMLQHLEETKGVSPEAAWDLALLKKEYTGFLSLSSLYESAYAEPVLPKLDKEYHLLFPSAFPKEKKLREFLEGKEHIHIHEACSFEGTLTAYQSEIEELRDVFLHIRSLLDDGAALDDIVITTAGAGRLRYQILEEARLFDIPVEFVQGSSPLSYPAGSFLSSLEDLYISRYSLSAMKEFFLNPAFPFRGRDKLRRFIRRAIDDSISSAPSKEKDRYRRIPDEDGGDSYRLLRSALDLLMTEKNPDRILPMVNQIMTGLLEEGEFNGREEDAAVYSFAMNELTKFLSKVKKAGSNGYMPGCALFPLFLRYLEKCNYVPKRKTGGVRVYSFSADAAVYAPYRFVMTLNENDSKKTVKDALFLSDYEIEGDREETDITGALLHCYSVFSGNLFLSASYDTYQGYALPLSQLGKEENERARLREDPWSYSAMAERIFPLQRLSAEKALSTSGRTSGEEDRLTAGLPGKSAAVPVSLNFSMLDSYIKCPFRYALEYRFGLSRIMRYDAEDIDRREIGTRLHAVMERFFREGGDPEMVVRDCFEDEMRLWQEGKKRDGDKIHDMPSSSFRPDASLVSWIRRKYLDNLVALAKSLSEGYEPAERGLESSFKDIEIPGQSYTLSGRVDMIAKEKETGDILLVDYKTTMPDLGKDPGKALQFQVYSLILEEARGWETARAAFAGFNKGTLKDVPPEGITRDDLLLKLSDAANGIASGAWGATEDKKENCEACRFRAVCRTRFAVS